MTNLLALDLVIEQALYTVRTPLGVAVFSFVTDFAGAATVVVVCLLAVWILHSGRKWEYALGLLLAVAGSAVVDLMLKELIARPRPPEYMHAVIETSYSFPSSHAAAAAALYGFLALSAPYIASRRSQKPLIMFCALVIVAVGFSRLYLGVHYFSDIIGGYVLGGAFAWLGLALAESFRDLISAFRRA
jgi:membrane-associated phospholipid phosphatase